MKKVLMILGAIFGLIIIIGAVFLLRAQHMVNAIRDIEIEHVDLNEVADGVYYGEFSEFLVAVELGVTVRDHQITKIEIIKQRSGPGYEALETIDRIIAVPSPKVDAVTGATGSSKSIVIAVENALSGN